MRTKNILRGKLYGDKIIGFLTDEEKAIDIDSLFDLKLAELIIKNDKN